jgi:type VI secretion system lysozyme-like protein
MLRLTERLNLLGTQGQGTKHEESISIATSMRGYLQKVLNTRVGSVLYSPQMGLDKIDVSAGLAEEDQEQLLKQIRMVLLRFDPRIATLSAQLKNNHNVTVLLSFQLSFTTQSKHAISMLGTLQSDSTFELELQ